MTHRELDTRIAEDLFDMVTCTHWRPTWFKDQGATLLRDPQFCPHPDGKCYAKIELVTLMGKLGGPPRYSETSHAALILLAELKRLYQTVVLVGSGDRWTMDIYMIEGYDEGLPYPKAVIETVSAPRPELAIALAAGRLIDIDLTAEEIIN